MFRTIASRVARASAVATLRVNRPYVRALAGHALNTARSNKVGDVISPLFYQMLTTSQHTGLLVFVGLASLATYSYAHR